MQDMSSLFNNSVTVVSSTNLWVIHASRNESIKIMNASGRKYDPCGIAADISNDSETMSLADADDIEINRPYIN